MRIVGVFSAWATVVSACLLSVAAPAQAGPVPAQAGAAEALAKAKSNCLTAVAKVVGLPRTSLGVIQAHQNASGISVEVRVPKAVAPWACLTNRQGEVKDTTFTGSEGKL